MHVMGDRMPDDGAAGVNGAQVPSRVINGGANSFSFSSEV
jgi:hypothetical protein